MKKLFVLLTVSLSMTCVDAQIAPGSFHDTYGKKIIYLDQYPVTEVLEMATNYHGWGKFGVSDTIFDYLMAKNTFSINPADTINIGGYGTYMALAHLRILKHRYNEAQTFLRLADMAAQPQPWCGNAARAIIDEKNAYEMLCKLMLSPSSQSQKKIDTIVGNAFDYYYDSYCSGAALVHYLKYRYGPTGMKNILLQAKYSIYTKLHTGEDESYVDVNGKLAGSVFEFRLYLDADAAKDANSIKKAAVNHFVGMVDNWQAYK